MARASPAVIPLAFEVTFRFDDFLTFFGRLTLLLRFGMNGTYLRQEHKLCYLEVRAHTKTTVQIQLPAPR